MNRTGFALVSVGGMALVVLVVIWSRLPARA